VDLFTSNIGDFLVVAAIEPSLKCEVAGDNIITAEQALELVRVILTAHGRFYINAEARVHEWSYYLYRHRKLFKGFQYALTVAACVHGKGLSEKAHDYFVSLGTRLNFICRAYDKVAFFSLKTANYNDQNAQLYHLAYFVMLITGVFDDLAHIIEECYHIEIERRTDSGLRISKAKAFYESLQSKNADLHEFLNRGDIQTSINAFYPIRDSLQHREFPIGIQFVKFPEDAKNLFELTDEAVDSLKMVQEASNCIVNLQKPCLNPLPFITWAQEFLIVLVNSILSYINWDSVCATLPVDIQDKIHAMKESFEQGVGQYLGWREEPLYF